MPTDLLQVLDVLVRCSSPGCRKERLERAARLILADKLFCPYCGVPAQLGDEHWKAYKEQLAKSLAEIGAAYQKL